MFLQLTFSWSRHTRWKATIFSSFIFTGNKTSLMWVNLIITSKCILHLGHEYSPLKSSYSYTAGIKHILQIVFVHWFSKVTHSVTSKFWEVAQTFFLLLLYWMSVSGDCERRHSVFILRTQQTDTAYNSMNSGKRENITPRACAILISSCKHLVLSTLRDTILKLCSTSEVL